MLDEIRAAELASVRPSPGAEGEDLLDVAVEDGPNQHTALERRELRTWLARALAELPERDRQILALYYDEELTLAEIGQVIGVGESRVSQLRTQAIARLRSRLHAFLEAGHRN
jgi:RNA polymerase sigma factor for flagellar operon FliA